MAYIKIMLDRSLMDGHEVTFNAPCDCTAIDGLKVCYIENNSLQTKTFAMKDAHGNALKGIGNLFEKGAYVKAILDSKNLFAYLQNADTNAYLEGKFKDKAPAGYGLGSYAQEVSGEDINTITIGGAYWWQNASNAPFSWGYMIVVPSNGDSYCTQNIYSMTETNAVRRIKTDAGWVTEYTNPPMALGVEYRTTERWNGKPVYTKLVDCGAAPDTATKDIALTAGNNAKNLIRWAGYASYAGIPLPTSHPEWESRVVWDGTYNTFVLVLTTTTDRTACNVYVQVWYIKN